MKSKIIDVLLGAVMFAGAVMAGWGVLIVLDRLMGAMGLT